MTEWSVYHPPLHVCIVNDFEICCILNGNDKGGDGHNHKVKLEQQAKPAIIEVTFENSKGNWQCQKG